MNDASFGATALGPATVLARFGAEQETARRFVDRLLEVLPEGNIAVAAFEGAAGAWSVEVHFATAPDEAEMRRLIGLVDPGIDVAFETLMARDWVAASLEGLKPVAAGRFLVHGAHDRHRVRANHIGIEIEAALAFGTGHHGTTRGCLLALDRLAKSRRPERQPRAGRQRILDIGTGTGVLAIAAARLFREPVLASDIDPTSVLVARENARHNGVSAPIDIIRASDVADRRFGRKPRFDLVFGNILLKPLETLSRPIRMLVAPGGRVVLSGLLLRQANAALAAYRRQGLVLERRIALDGWATLVLARPGKSPRRPRT